MQSLILRPLSAIIILIGTGIIQETKLQMTRDGQLLKAASLYMIHARQAGGCLTEVTKVCGQRHWGPESLFPAHTMAG